MCAEVQKQQKTPKKWDDTSPTVSTESVLITTTIDVYKNQYFKIVDVTCTLFTAYMYEEVILFF